MKLKHKFCRTFVAMFWGWVACNPCLLVLAFSFPEASFSFTLFSWMHVTLCSAVIVFLAWLLIFLPVDLAVKESSSLRDSRKAAGCGALAGFLSAFLPMVIPGLRAEASEMLIVAPVSAVCGLVASLHVVRRYPCRLHCESLPQSPLPYDYPHSVL